MREGAKRTGGEARAQDGPPAAVAPHQHVQRVEAREQLSLLDIGTAGEAAGAEDVELEAAATEELETPGTDVAGQMFFLNQQDSPACPDCGSITVRNGACYRCYNCGNSMGCS